MKADGKPQDFQMLDLVAPDFRVISGQVYYLSGHKNFHKLHRHVRKNVRLSLGDEER